jgi:hypothetical protein
MDCVTGNRMPACFMSLSQPSALPPPPLPNPVVLLALSAPHPTLGPSLALSLPSSSATHYAGASHPRLFEIRWHPFSGGRCGFVIS